MLVTAVTPARQPSRWLWFSVLELIFDWLLDGRRYLVDILEKSSHALWARLSCHDWMFWVLCGNQSEKAGLFLEIKQLPSDQRLSEASWSSFELLYDVCLWCPIHCSLVHGHICVCVHEYAGPYILLVLRNLTSLHWTLAVYTGNCSPCPNLPLPARLSHHRTSSAAGAFSIVSLMIPLALCSIDIANKLSRMTKGNFYKVKSTKQLVIVGPNVYHSSLVFSQNKVIIRINLIQACW